MQFTDRNKQFIKNCRINKVDTGESILAEITRNQSDENLSAPLNKGTLINAELLNGMFAAKQNKIVPKEGILLNGNRLEADSGCFIPDYSAFAKNLVCDFRYSANTQKWTAAPNPLWGIGYGEHYLCQAENSFIRYADADISFDVENVFYDASVDRDPTIAIKFIDSSDDMKSIFCLFGFAEDKVRLIRHGEWRELGSKYGVSYNKTDGVVNPFKVGVKRRKDGNGIYIYDFFVNGSKAASLQSATATTDYNAIAIGAIGCRATLKNWNIHGTY